MPSIISCLGGILRFAAGVEPAAVAKKETKLVATRKVGHELLSSRAIAVGSYAGAAKTAWTGECKRP